MTRVQAFVPYSFFDWFQTRLPQISRRLLVRFDDLF